MRTEIPIKYDENGLIPTVVQQHDTGEVLMVAYMNEESLQRTLDSRTTWFWSRNDCDADTLLVLVDAAGPACHTGERTCFYRVVEA
jgi:phosphoribosyl-AMP cyclohydrolase